MQRHKNQKLIYFLKFLLIMVANIVLNYHVNGFISSERGIFYVLNTFLSFIRLIWINFEEKNFENLNYPLNNKKH